MVLSAVAPVCAQSGGANISNGDLSADATVIATKLKTGHEYGERSPQNVVDNDPSTGWQVYDDGDYTYTYSDTIFIGFQFDDPVFIGCVTLEWEKDSRPTESGFKVQYLLDGIKWHDVQNARCDYSDDGAVVNFDRVTAKFVRVLFSEGTNDKYKPKIYEMKAYSFPQSVDTSGVISATAAQLSSDGTQLRLIAAVDSLSHDKIGFSVTAEGKTKAFSDKTVYSSVKTNGGTYTAKSFGLSSGYIFMLIINGIPESGAEFTVTAFTLDGGKYTYGDKSVFNVSGGELTQGEVYNYLDAWQVEQGVDYSAYDYLGRGEELLQEIDRNYSGKTVTYTINGSSSNRETVQGNPNLMAKYTVSGNNVTVDCTTIQVRALTDQPSYTAAQGEVLTISFVTNLPTKFTLGINNNTDPIWGYDNRGYTFVDDIDPTGSDGVYTAKLYITAPYVTPGNYYLVIALDKWYDYPIITAVPFTVTAGEHADDQYHLLYAGSWDLLNDFDGYKQYVDDLFYNTYPRLYARWGLGNEPTDITFSVEPDLHGAAAVAWGTNVAVDANFANDNPTAVGFFSHELTHSVQQYGNVSGTWFVENMANYGGFRYYHWSNAEFVQIYEASDTSLQDWGYDPYGNNKWFFAYMDAKYPTRKDQNGNITYGLLDSLNRMFKQNPGTNYNDDPYNTESAFNKKVKEITGYDCIESLRLRFVEELKAGTWTFTGFADYEDNFITENLPGVENPDYPMITAPVHGNKTASAQDAYTSGTNLCLSASIKGSSGRTNAAEDAIYLIDGNENTKWCHGGEDVDATYCLDGTQEWVIIDLGSNKTFNTYTIYNTGTKEWAGNMVEWEILISNDAKTWTSIDYQPHCDRNTASFNVGTQNARYILLRSYDSDNGSDGCVRLYEFMLFNR